MGAITTSKTFTTESIMESYGIPESVWKPIQWVESKGKPDAYVKTSNEESVGLFQLNRLNGLGVGYSVSQLKDPVVNATIAAKKMSPIVKQGQAKGLTGYDLTKYVAANGGWPTQQGVSAMPQSYETELKKAFGIGGNVNESGVSTGSVSLDDSAVDSGDDSNINLLSLGTDKLTAAFWLIIGVVVIFFGFKLVTNPFSNITDAIGKLNVGRVASVDD